MVNPTIYVSCIKQFWSSISLKKTNDVVRLQALIDRRKVIITEDTVQQALRFDDAESIDCLPNEEIFAELARMGYEKPSTNLVRNVDSSSKFYVYLRFLQLMINDQVGDLSSHTTKYTSPVLTQKVFVNMRRVGKGFSEVDTPLFEGMLVPQQVHNGVADDVADEVKKEEKVKSFWVKEIEEGGIAELDADEDVTLEEVTAKITKDVDIQGRLEESQAHVYHFDLEHAQKVLSMQDDEAEPTKLKEVIKVVTTAKLMTKVVIAATTTITAASMPKASAARRRKGVVIRDPEETATPSVIMHFEPKSKDKGKGILVEEPKPLKKQAQIEQDEAYAREEDLEMLWKIIQERFASSEQKNFLDDFLLNALKTMFEKPNVEAHIWKNQRGSYGLAKVKSWKLLKSCGVHIITFTTTQMILLVERRCPLTIFTLDQMLNNVRLEVEKKSEVSLELLRFVRRQQQEGYMPE
nr:hypothetical protein [Tanacetum cinerariifolium]